MREKILLRNKLTFRQHRNSALKYNYFLIVSKITKFRTSDLHTLIQFKKTKTINGRFIEIKQHYKDGRIAITFEVTCRT